MDRVVETPHGYDCIVNGKRFGTWRSRAEAVGGLFVERERAAGHKDKRRISSSGDVEAYIKSLDAKDLAEGIE